MKPTDKQLEQLWFIIEDYDGARTVGHSMKNAWDFVARQVREAVSDELKEMAARAASNNVTTDAPTLLMAAAEHIKSPGVICDTKTREKH